MASVVDLAAYRAAARKRAAVPSQCVVGSVSVVPSGIGPYILTAHQDAVSLVTGEAELWLSPAEALGLGEELIRLAHEAARGADG